MPRLRVTRARRSSPSSASPPCDSRGRCDMWRKLSVGLVSLVALAAAGCTEENGYTTVPDRDDLEFTGTVLPILLRDCGFQACHGSQERFFRVYGPGRTRLGK